MPVAGSFNLDGGTEAIDIGFLLILIAVNTAHRSVIEHAILPVEFRNIRYDGIGKGRIETGIFPPYILTQEKRDSKFPGGRPFRLEIGIGNDQLTGR